MYHGRRRADLALGVLSTLTSPSQSCQGPGSCLVPSVWCTPVCHVGFYSWAASSEVQIPPLGLYPYKKKKEKETEALVTYYTRNADLACLQATLTHQGGSPLRAGALFCSSCLFRL